MSQPTPPTVGILEKVIWQDNNQNAFIENLIVSDNSSFYGNVTAWSDTTFNGDMSISGDLGVSGYVGITGELGITGPVNIHGVLGVTGDVNIRGSQLNVMMVQDTNIDSTRMSVFGQEELNIFGTSIGVTGDVNISTLENGFTLVSNGGTGPVNIHGVLGVTGDVDIRGSQLNVMMVQDTIIDSTRMSVFGQEELNIFGASIGVTGDVNISTYDAGFTLVSNGGTGPVNIHGVLGVTGDVDITGTLTSSERLTVSSGGVGVTGPVDIRGDIDIVTGVAGFTLNSDSGAGPVNISGMVDITGNLGVTGTITSSERLTVSSGGVGVTGPVDIEGNLGVTGDVGIVGVLGVTGDVGIVGVLGVTGDVGIVGDLGVTGNVDVTGTITSSDRLIVSSGGVGVTGPVDIEGNLGVTGDVDIVGDLILNGISLAEISAGLTPTEIVVRNCNPLSYGVKGNQEQPGRMNVDFPDDQYPYNFIGGWSFVKTDANSKKINWNFIPGSINTRVKDFQGFNINIYGYTNELPFVTIYTRNPQYAVTGPNWYQNRITFIPSPIDGSNFVDPIPYTYAITYGKYDNSLVRGYNICVSTITNENEPNGNPLTTANLEDIQNDIITSYVVQTTSATSNYRFILNSVNITETQEESGKTYQTVFNNVCTQLF